MSEANEINEKMIRSFATTQSYLDIDKHYMPMEIDNISDESSLEADSERVLQTLFSITLSGYLIDEEEFEEVEGIARLAVSFDEQS